MDNRRYSFRFESINNFKDKLWNSEFSIPLFGGEEFSLDYKNVWQNKVKTKGNFSKRIGGNNIFINKLLVTFGRFIFLTSEKDRSMVRCDTKSCYRRKFQFSYEEENNSITFKLPVDQKYYALIKGSSFNKSFYQKVELSIFRKDRASKVPSSSLALFLSQCQL